MKIQLKSFTVADFYSDIDVCFDASVTGIVGKNGSGKSLFCRYLMGIYNNYQGDIIFDNIVLTDQNYAFFSSKIKLLTHNPENQFLGYSVYDEISYKLFQRGFDKQRIGEVYDEFFSEFDPNQVITLLDYDSQVKLLVLSLICLRPDFLIIDEGLSICCDGFKQEVFTLLKLYDVKVIYVTNNIYDSKFCDVTYCLEDGKFEKFEKFVDYSFTYLPNVERLILSYCDENVSFEVVEGINLCGNLSDLVIKSLVSGYNNVSVGLVDRYGLNQVYFIYVYEMFASSGRSWIDVYRVVSLIGFGRSLFCRELNTLSTGELTFVLFVFQVLLGRELVIFNHCFEVLDLVVRRAIVDYCFDCSISLLVVTNNKLIFNGFCCNVIGD